MRAALSATLGQLASACLILGNAVVGAQLRGEAKLSSRSGPKRDGVPIFAYGQPEASVDGLLELRDPATGASSRPLIAVQVETTEDETVHGG